MLKQKRFKKATAAFLALTLMAVWLTMTLCTVTVSAENESTGTINGVDDLVGKTIGVQLGTTGDTFATDYEKDGTARVERYNKAADAVQAHAVCEAFLARGQEGKGNILRIFCFIVPVGLVAVPLVDDILGRLVIVLDKSD